MGVDSARRVVYRFLAARYEPEPSAPASGEWDRSGDEPRWAQAHAALVKAALQSWKAESATMPVLIRDERHDAPLPDSGSGKKMRAQAAALLWELEHKARRSPQPLYRGSHENPKGLNSWTSFLKTAELWAAKNNGKVFTLPKGTKGLRVSDYLGSDPEREWLVET